MLTFIFQMARLPSRVGRLRERIQVCAVVLGLGSNSSFPSSSACNEVTGLGRADVCTVVPQIHRGSHGDRSTSICYCAVRRLLASHPVPLGNQSSFIGDAEPFQCTWHSPENFTISL